MERQRVETLARRFISALQNLEDGGAGEAEVIAALFADDARLSNAALQLHGEEHRGRTSVRDFWRAYRRAFDEVRSEFHHVMANDRAAGLFWTSSGTYRGGTPFVYDGVTLLEFDDSGKIVRLQGYFDTRQLSREAGA
ncbi:MAG: nuclear transport factor 2 family protein [Chloroflexota bacterium]|nr:MAG: nuclear transport factor 2 family protein [Chloroflexota bacterium]